MKRKTRKKLITVFSYVLLILIAVIQMIPLVVMFLNSVRTNEDIQARLIAIPEGFHWENFVTAWTRGGYLQAYISNLIIGLAAAFIVLLVTGLAAYGLVKLEAPGAGFFRTYFTAGLSIPGFAIIATLFFMFNRIGLVNTRTGMIIIYTAINIPFNFMFVHAFFQGMPKELDEAARIDGATEMQNFRYNVLPLAKPIFTTVLLIVFVNVWNEFLFANTFLQDDSVRTVALRFYNFVGKNSGDPAYIYAAAVISVLPILVMYMLMQDTFVEGMTSGSVKG